MYTKHESLGRRLANPHFWIAFGFFVAILLGTGLLCLPVASASGKALPPLVALFMATSATCVTGLSIVDVSTELSITGQVIVLVLIQLGGIGIMTFGTFLLVLVGRRLSLQNEFVLIDAYGINKVQGLHALIGWIIGFTFLFEGIGAAVLYWRYRALGMAQGVPWTRTFYHSVFHAVSAFCNSGVTLYPDSLQQFKHDPLYLLTIGALVVTGGLGFLVLYNLVTIRFWRRDLRTRGRLSLHTKIVLTMTLILLLGGTVLILAEEWSGTLSGLAWHDKLACSFFHSVSPRTAGFVALPVEHLSEGTRYVTTLLMLAGGSPGSTAGGMKTTTILVLVLTVVAMCKRRREIVVFARTIPYTIVQQAISIAFICVTMVLVAYGLLLWTEHVQDPSDASRLLFEVVCAITTVGMSPHTPQLTIAGKWIVVVCMYLGRLGPLTVALVVSRDDEVFPSISYPKEEVVVG
ncbi:MAG: hypothetical protein FWH21_06670 [Kiritimatiellaeota bacterium]|nr:hypothetical protein [Kiritimatiellota bacterium]